MDRNVKIAKELVKLAKMLVSSGKDIEFSMSTTDLSKKEVNDVFEKIEKEMHHDVKRSANPLYDTYITIKDVPESEVEEIKKMFSDVKIKV